MSRSYDKFLANKSGEEFKDEKEPKPGRNEKNQNNEFSKKDTQQGYNHKPDNQKDENVSDDETGLPNNQPHERDPIKSGKS